MKTCPTCQHAYPDDVEFCPRDGAHLAAQPTETEAQLAAGLSRRFRLVRRLGTDGMGTVFLAEQIGVDNRLVALKVLNRKLLDDPDFLLRFQNEAGSTGRIHHPNIVSIYESAQADDGTPYIAMEFLEGESLRQALKRRGALSVPEVAEILQQTARGLNAAHELGIIHCDLKPDNIFLTRNAENELRVKVVGFAIPKLRESSTHTQTGMVLGTPAYMSYEQVSGMRGDELDARSDVYSLGVVVYEMLSGRVPFLSDTPLGYLRQHMLEDPPPFHEVAPDLAAPPAVESAVMKALVKDRNQRYGSALDFARELACAAQLWPLAETPVPPPSTRIVSPPARPSAAREPAAPLPLHETGQAKADTAVQTPSPVPPERIGETPTAQPQASKPTATASRPPTATKPPQFRMVAGPSGKMKFVAIAVVALILVVAGVWYSSQHGPKKGEVRVNPKDGLNYVWIPPGSFEMGCSPGDTECNDDEKPPHQVTLTKGFWLGQTEVSVAAYKGFAGATGRQMPPEPSLMERPLNPGWGDEAMPIVNVTWDDAQAYCSWAGGRLPTEAEGEYAARGGSTASRYGDLDEIAWNADNSGRERLDSDRIWKEDEPNFVKRLKENGNAMHEAGQKRANTFGLYDILGNVWEWVSDWYDEKYYQSSPSQDPAGPASGEMHVLRGGSWLGTPRNVRVSSRYRPNPGLRYVNFGFRCGGEVFVP